ncbi:MAG: hypothetical protein E7328_00300 [Clostridiales bacterium]|nr:hypothetical protein [Clostridiales bacterium]
MNRLWNRLKHNFALKATALFFAIMLWSFVISETDPERSRAYNNIPVEIVGLSQLENDNLAVKGDVSAIFGDANLSLTLKVSEIGTFDPSAVGVMADLSSIREPGKYNIPLVGHAPVGSIAKVIPQSITIEVEERHTAQFPVQVIKKGTLAGGLYSTDPVITPQYVEVSGAASDVAAIRNAVVYLDESSLSSQFSSELPVVLLNENGEEISHRRFSSGAPTVDVFMDVLPVKKLSVDVDDILGRIEGLPWGYRAVSVMASPGEVEVAGEAEVLSKLSTISVGSVNVDGAKEDVTISASVILPEGTIATTTKEITLTVVIARDR